MFPIRSWIGCQGRCTSKNVHPLHLRLGLWGLVFWGGVFGFIPGGTLAQLRTDTGGPQQEVQRVPASTDRSISERSAKPATQGSPQKVPYSLAQLIELSVHSHPSVASKRAGMNAAQAEVDAARHQYYPTPSVQLGQGTQGGVSTILALQQPLWTWGRLDAGLDAASARTEAAKASITEAQQTLALRVVAVWQTWLQARGRIAALKQAIDSLKAYDQSATRRVEAGASGAADSALVKARLAQAQGDLAAAWVAERSSLAQLTQLAGQKLESQDIAHSAEYVAATMELAALIEQALKSAPALLRAQAEIDALSHEIKQRRAALWPTLNLRAEQQRMNSGMSGQTNNDSRVLLTLDYTPGAGLSAAAFIKAASERMAGLLDTQEALRRETMEKVSIEFEELQSSRSRQGDLEHSLKASAEVLASYERLFIAGKRGWLDVLNAARELLQANIALVEVRTLRLASNFRLRLYTEEIVHVR